MVYGGAGQSNYVAAKAGVQAFTEAVATEMAPYGVTANTIMPGANTRLAQIGWRMARAGRRRTPTVTSFDPRDPVHVAEFGVYLASPDARLASRARRSRCAAASSNTSRRGRSTQPRERTDRGFTADDYAQEIPRLFGAGGETGRSAAAGVEGICAARTCA